MLLNLFVCKLEYLLAIGKCRLGGLCLTEIVDNMLIRESLLDVAVIKVHNRVTIWEGFSSYFVAENDLFLTIDVDSLNFSIIACDLILDCMVFISVTVILLWELKIVFCPVQYLFTSSGANDLCILFFSRVLERFNRWFISELLFNHYMLYCRVWFVLMQ